MRIEWTTDLWTQNPEIDRQHGELIEWCNALNDEQGGLARSGRLAEALHFVARYVEFHFAAEEEAMEAAGYPAREAHARGHAFFKRQVATLRRELAADGRGGALRLHQLMEDWFLQHIRQEDRRMAAWLREHAPGHGLCEGASSLASLMRAAGIDVAELERVRFVKAHDLPPKERRRGP